MTLVHRPIRNTSPPRGTAALPVVSGMVAALSAPALILSAPSPAAAEMPIHLTIIGAALPPLLAIAALLCGMSAAQRGSYPLRISRRQVYLSGFVVALLLVTGAIATATVWARVALPLDALLIVVTLSLARAGRGPHRRRPRLQITTTAALSLVGLIMVSYTLLTAVLAALLTPLFRHISGHSGAAGIVAIPATLALALVVGGLVWQLPTVADAD